MKTEIIFGHHPVQEAIRARRRKIHQIYISREIPSPRNEKIIARAEADRVPVERLPADKMLTLARTDHHQGIGARVSPFPTTDARTLIDRTRDSGLPPFFLIADSVLDPHNLGALIRTALSVGVQGVFTPRDRSAPPTATVSKASAGALEHVNLARVTNLSRTITILKEAGLWVFGLDRAADRQIYAADMSGPTALVVGGEEKGIRPLVKKHCDLLVSIPQYGPLDSLNASVAGAVAMYEVVRQRHHHQSPKPTC